MSDPLLKIDKLTLRFGGLTAVKDVDLAVPQGKIVALIGPNGAGKTTVFNAISGIYDPTSGDVRFHGQALRMPFGNATVVVAILVGLVTALGTYLLAVNPDLLWMAAIRRPNNESLWLKQRFRYSEMLERTGQYLRGDLTTQYAPRLVRMPLIADRTGLADPKLTYNVPGYEIVSSEGRVVLRGVISDDFQEADLEREARKYELVKRGGRDRLLIEQARERRDTTLAEIAESSRQQAAEALEALKSGELSVVGQENEWRLASDGNAVPGLVFPSEVAANDAVASLEAMRDARPSRQAFRLVAPLLGFVLGIAGYLTVWSRARRTPDVIARSGIARTFQNIRLFHNMTVLENVLVGMDRHYRSGVLAMIFRTPGTRAQESERCATAMELLKFMGLDERCDSLAKNLPYGDQRRLEIARAIASEPQLLLLDEPAAGMNPAESGELMTLIRAIRDRGITVLLIEHHMKLVMEISDRIAVLEYGVKIAEGTPEEVRKNPKVIEAYLGKEEVH